MRICEVSKHEFECRFGSGTVSKIQSKLWMVNDSMGLAVTDRGEMEVFGDTNLSEEEEFELMLRITPAFAKDREAIPSSISIEKYMEESAKLKVTNGLMFLSSFILLIIICLTMYIAVVR